MKIIVDLTDEKGHLTFGDVKIHEFFLSFEGNLCQKCGEYSYNVITDADGKLCSGRIDNCARHLFIEKKIDLAFKLRNEIS